MMRSVENWNGLDGSPFENSLAATGSRNSLTNSLMRSTGIKMSPVFEKYTFEMPLAEDDNVVV
jgi:hypothetical protein